jgi:hypothetical protein
MKVIVMLQVILATFIFIVSTFSMYAMEPVSVVLQRERVLALKKLCRAAIVQNIQSSHDLEKFAEGKTQYHLLPQEAHDKIAKKLPGRPRIQRYIDKVCGNYLDIVHNPNHKLGQCIVPRSSKVRELIDINSGQSLYTFDNPDTVDICFSDDGKRLCITYYNHFLDNRNGLGSNNTEIVYFKKTFKKGLGYCLEYVPQWTGFSHYTIFTSHKNECIIRPADRSYTLLDIISGDELYKGMQKIRECTQKNWLLLLQNNILRIIDRSANNEILTLEDTKDFVLNYNGTQLFRVRIDCLGELIDLDIQKVLLTVELSDRSLIWKNHFSSNGRYCLLVNADSTVSLLDLTDLSRGVKKIVDDPFHLNFSDKGNYLHLKRWHWRNGEDNNPGTIITIYIKVEDLFNADVKEDVSIEEICQLNSALISDRLSHKLLSPDEKYLCKISEHNVEIIAIDSGDTLLNISHVFNCCHPSSSCLFSSDSKRLLFLPHPKIVDAKTPIIYLDNDLTIDQFLLQQLIITHQMTQQQINDNEYLCDVYNSLSAEQKKYFAEHVFH